MCFSRIELKTSEDPERDVYATVPAVLRYEQGDGKDFHVDPAWVGCLIQTGPDPVEVHQLGRLYISGNEHTHPLMLAKRLAGGEVEIVAEADVDMSPANLVDGMGFKYGPIADGPKTLDPDTEYTLLSREGLGPEDKILRAEVETDLSRTTARRDDGDGFIGFQFKTGPLGMRITHMARMDGATAGPDAARTFVIDEVLEVLGPTNEPTGFETTRVLETTIDDSDPVDAEGYRVHELAYPGEVIDLKPLTRHFVGTFVGEGDEFHGGVFEEPDGEPGPGMPRLTFDPNVLQFFNAALTEGETGAWRTGDESMRDTGAVFGPVTLRCQISDRFYGVSPEDETGSPIDAMPRLVVDESLGVKVEGGAYFNPFVTFGWRRADEGNALVGPIDLVFATDEGDQSLVQDFESTAWLDHPRSGQDSFTGWAGLRITVGNGDVTLKGVGRYIQGDQLHRHHELVVANISDNSFYTRVRLLAGDYADRKSPLGFAYRDLPQPFTLEAGRSYFIGSGEDFEEGVGSENFDPYYGFDSEMPIVRTGSAFEVLKAVKAPENPDGSLGEFKEYFTAEGACFGPLNVRCAPLDLTPLESVDVRTRNTNWAGYHGYRFRTGQRPLTVRSLGRWCLPGNTQQHEVRIQKVAIAPLDPRANPSPVIASALIDASQAQSEGFIYTRLDTPALLEADTEYMIGGYETPDGDLFAADAVLTPAQGRIEILAGTYTHHPHDGPGGPWYTAWSTAPPRVLGAVDFKIQ